MSLSNNSVYSSVFTYNPCVLTRPYKHLTIMDMIGLHQITWVSHNIQSISVSIVGFGDCACTCKINIPMSCHKQISHSSTKVYWHNKYNTYPSSLFKFFTLFAASLLVNLKLRSDAIPMAYQINAH